MKSIYKEIEEYLTDFFKTREEKFCLFFEDIRKEYRSKQKPLQDDRIARVVDMVDSLEGNISCFSQAEYVPQVFASYQDVINSLVTFSRLSDTFAEKIKKLFPDNPPYYMNDFISICHEITSASNYVKELLSQNQTEPYFYLREDLLNRDIDFFVKDINSILASIPYNIRHEKLSEGYFHTTLHVILKMLGFDFISENPTDLGRIDMSIRFKDFIYIMEFKYSATNEDLSEEALNQIKTDRYAEKYRIERIPVFCVGISFSHDTRNINNHKFKVLDFRKDIEE